MARAAATAASPMRSRSSAIDGGRGRLLDHLLVAALHRAVALAEMDDVAVRVGEDLDLDVARRRRPPSPGSARPSRRRLPPRRGAAPIACGRSLALDQPHAAPAAAGRGLDHQRQADARGFLRSSVASAWSAPS